MKHAIKWILLAGVLAFGNTAARAEFVFLASLDASQEVPPPNVPSGYAGTGLGFVTLNDAQDQITVQLAYANLTGEATLAHIHGPAAPGDTAPPIFDLTPFLPVYPPGFPVTNFGLIDGVTFAITPDQVQDLFAGLLYFNIHTAQNPTGEIRGQITQLVPEPSSAAMMGIGLTTALGLTLRRRLRSRAV